MYLKEVHTHTHTEYCTMCKQYLGQLRTRCGYIIDCVHNLFCERPVGHLYKVYSAQTTRRQNIQSPHKKISKNKSS